MELHAKQRRSFEVLRHWLAWSSAILVLLLALPFPLRDFDWIQFPSDVYDWFWGTVAPPIAHYLLGWSTPLNGAVYNNSDSEYTVAHLVAAAVIAAALGAIAAAKSSPPGSKRFSEATRAYARYYLAAEIAGYGAVKLIPSQFHIVPLTYLAEPLAYRTPIGLLWTFMGASTTYTIFTGAVEVLGGVLLLFRRTVALGALICLAALGNVFMLNAAYHGVAKFFVVQLLVVTLYLLTPYLRPLASLFVLGKNAILPTPPDVFDTTPINTGVRVAGLLTFSYLLTLSLVESASEFRSDRSASTSSLSGVYDVANLSFDQSTSSAPDSLVWQRLVVEPFGAASITFRDGHRLTYRATIDTTARTLRLIGGFDPRVVGPSDTTSSGVFTYVVIASAKLDLAGTFNTRGVHASLVRSSDSRFRLASHRFRWISAPVPVDPY